jgi:hypothetical protein
LMQDPRRGRGRNNVEDPSLALVADQ